MHNKILSSGPSNASVAGGAECCIALCLDSSAAFMLLARIREIETRRNERNEVRG